MESHYINALGFACESQTTLLFYLFCQYSLCVSLSLIIYIHIYTSEILFMKLWKIINLKTLRKNKKELKRIKVTSISEEAGNICVCGGRGEGGVLNDFSLKKLLPRQASELTVGKLGAVNLPIRSRGRCLKKLEIHVS